MAKPVIYEREGYVARLTLNRPEHHNAIDDDLLLAMGQALLQAEEDIDARIVVIRGAGPDFSVGEDLSAGAKVSEVLPPDVEQLGLQQLSLLTEKKKKRWQYLLNFPRPTIAVVHGRCMGLALNIALLCDFVFASEDAIFADRSLRFGILPSIPLWPFLVNAQVAKDYLYSGRDVPAAEAQHVGMITKVVPASQLDAEVNRYVKGMLCSPADSLAWNKEASTAILEMRGVSNAWRIIETKHVQAAYTLREKWQSFVADREALGLAKALEKRNKPFTPEVIVQG